MERYKNLSGDSGVHSYEFNNDQIVVRFNDRATYTYTNQSVGSTNLAKLKELATVGRGLNSYINKTPSVRKHYASRSVS
jgi:hypothetical protein